MQSDMLDPLLDTWERYNYVHMHTRGSGVLDMC